FDLSRDSDGGYVAACLGEDIFTQGGAWEELRHNVSDAVLAYYFDSEPPARIRLHFVHDEVVTTR
ncbi:MAG: 2-phospho-L-lactate guanylyltransferase, partial [Candidatus Brocadiia bacterium]